MSINDPLVQFRKEHTIRTAANDNKASKIGTGKKPYEAFDSTGKPSLYTEIRCVLQPSQSPQSRPEELEKLKNYITSYLMKRDSSEVLE